MKDLQIGYQVPLEQFQPEGALEQAKLAEKSGFDSVWVSDHFHPWFNDNSAGVFAWAWLAAASQITKQVKLGTGLTCPTLRYHPGIVAQAFATLDNLGTDRIFLSLGIGEALNEVPLGYPWPSFAERTARLEEAISVIRQLWSGEFVDFRGRYYGLKRARLYTPPKGYIPIYVGASGPKMAEIAGRLCDRFLTLNAPEEKIRDVVFPAFVRGLEQSHRSFDDVFKDIEIGMSYAQDHEKAIKAIRPWAGSIPIEVYREEISDPREIEHLGSLLRDKEIEDAWVIGTGYEPFIRIIERQAKMGFNAVHVMNVSPAQQEFFELFRTKVIPYFKNPSKK